MIWVVFEVCREHGKMGLQSLIEPTHQQVVDWVWLGFAPLGTAVSSLFVFPVHNSDFNTCLMQLFAVSYWDTWHLTLSFP